ncbi:MAG: hypothetical protein ABII71_01540 [Candidatus Micrarchaeota archaeon]
MSEFPICPKCHRKADVKEGFLCPGCGFSGTPRRVTMEEYEQILSGIKPRPKGKRRGVALMVIGVFLILFSVFYGSMAAMVAGSAFFIAGILYNVLATARMPIGIANLDEKRRVIGMKVAEAKLRLEREMGRPEPDVMKMERFEKEVAFWEGELKRLSQ